MLLSITCQFLLLISQLCAIIVKRYAAFTSFKRRFSQKLQFLLLDMPQLLASLASSTYLFLLYYIVVENFKANNSNRKLIFNAFDKLYIKF